MRSSFLFIVLLMMGCASRNESEARLFLSNSSLDIFDKSLFKIFVDKEIVFSDTIKNQYISFHWRESTIKVPKDSFTFRVIISGKGYAVDKDTVISYATDSLKLFVRFNFYPRYKRYRNPEIYRHLPKETTRFKEIADSLYANNLLPNAGEYLNDTIPLPKNIEINVR